MGDGALKATVRNVQLSVMISVLITIGCGQPPPVDVPASPRPPAISDPSATWTTYMSAKWGYTLRYPATWLDIPNNGAPDSEKYIASENVGSPLALSATGLYLTIEVNQSASEYCGHNELSQAQLAGTNRPVPVTVDGAQTTLHLGPLPPMQAIYSSVRHASYCYLVVFLFQTITARDAAEVTAKAVVESFRFGTVP